MTTYTVFDDDFEEHAPYSNLTLGGLVQSIVAFSPK